MMVKLVNRAKMTTATTGTGTLTLGSAVDGFQTFAQAGVADADVVRYVIEDGTAWEIGTGTYTASGTTLTRTPSESSIGGGAITLSGDAVVFVGAVAADIADVGTVGGVTTRVRLDGAGTFTVPAGVTRIRVYIVGGGGGGGGQFEEDWGGFGGDTTFGAFTANGGVGGNVWVG